METPLPRRPRQPRPGEFWRGSMCLLWSNPLCPSNERALTASIHQPTERQLCDKNRLSTCFGESGPCRTNQAVPGTTGLPALGSCPKAWPRRSGPSDCAPHVRSNIALSIADLVSVARKRAECTHLLWQDRCSCRTCIELVLRVGSST